MLRFAASKDVDRRIDSLFEYYRRRDVPFVWMVHPTARPLNLDNRLRARGLQEVETCQGMSMRRDQLPDPEEPPHLVGGGQAGTRSLEFGGTRGGYFALDITNPVPDAAR